MQNIISNRIADTEIYNNRSFYNEPKEYYNLVLSKILKSVSKPHSLLDIGCSNGSFLFHASKVLAGTKLYGVEPVHDLAEIAQRNTSADIAEIGLFDIAAHCKYEIITMLGVLGIFTDVIVVLTKLKEIMASEGSVYVISSFNEEDIDVVLNYRRAPVGPWESGHNLFSMKTVEYASKKLGMKCEWIDFKMSKPIPKTDDPMRSWTEPFRNNENHLFYGTNMFSTMKLLILK